MQRRKIHHTPVELTELGFVASVIGNLYRVTPASDAAAAVDAGIRCFDTAPHPTPHLPSTTPELPLALHPRPRSQASG
ncbi:hypothetical protein [Streptomyces sp. 11x1]|uniref:hypothetical protein n=1 Tax=Streptomyces sp. 11x1 TaxID=3038642 RepID=UPI0037DA11AC